MTVCLVSLIIETISVYRLCLTEVKSGISKDSVKVHILNLQDKNEYIFTLRKDTNQVDIKFLQLFISV